MAARSDRIAPDQSSTLAWEPIPFEDEIDGQPECTVEPLIADEFETVWRSAADDD
jgi:hypothetical protein